MFKDKEVDQKVKYKLGIFNNREPREADLNKITEIIISNLNLRGEFLNTDITELVRLKKLRSLELKGFNLDEEVRRVIHSFPELESLTFYKCESKNPASFNIETLKYLILDHCKKMNLTEFNLPKNVYIIDGGVINISDLKEIDRVKKLEIRNSEIINSKKLSDIKSLKSLNVDGSNLDDDNIINELKSKKIEVSNEYESHPII